jgi:hypothetical protein
VAVGKKYPFNFLCDSGWFARIETRGVGGRIRWFLSVPPRARVHRLRAAPLREQRIYKRAYIKVKQMVYPSYRSNLEAIRNFCAAQSDNFAIVGIAFTFIGFISLFRMCRAVLKSRRSCTSDQRSSTLIFRFGFTYSRDLGTSNGGSGARACCPKGSLSCFPPAFYSISKSIRRLCDPGTTIA